MLQFSLDVGLEVGLERISLDDLDLDGLLGLNSDAAGGSNPRVL